MVQRDREGLAPSDRGEGEAASDGLPTRPEGVNDQHDHDGRSETRPSQRRGVPYDPAELDERVWAAIYDLEPASWREVSRQTGIGMSTLVQSVDRLRAAGRLIPAIPGRYRYLMTIKED